MRDNEVVAEAALSNLEKERGRMLQYLEDRIK
jgi:hypothetical protein